MCSFFSVHVSYYDTLHYGVIMISCVQSIIWAGRMRWSISSMQVHTYIWIVVGGICLWMGWDDWRGNRSKIPLKTWGTIIGAFPWSGCEGIVTYADIMLPLGGWLSQGNIKMHNQQLISVSATTSLHKGWHADHTKDLLEAYIDKSRAQTLPLIVNEKTGNTSVSSDMA